MLKEQEVTIDIDLLTKLTTEYNDLSLKVLRTTPTPSEKIRIAFLQSGMAAVRAGASIDEVNEAEVRMTAERGGLKSYQFKSSAARHKESRAKGWQQFIEKRDMIEGDPLSRIGSYTGLGYFVPTEFFPEVFTAMKAADALFSEDAVTFINSTNGRPLTIPVMGDCNVVASVVGEGGSQSSVDITSTGQAVVGAYSYTTPRFVASLESFQDLEGSLTVTELFKRFSADRLARGISADLVNGDGSGRPLGLLNSLINIGAPIIHASGSAANDGSSATGANSLGSQDFAAALQTLDSAYQGSDKCAWFMSNKTLGALLALTDKVGRPLGLVTYIRKKPYIMGVRVRVCPSLPDIGVSATPVILGDGSYWATRLVVDDMAGIMPYTQAPGLAENGKVGFRAFVRADGQLLYTANPSQSPCPFVLIRNAS